MRKRFRIILQRPFPHNVPKGESYTETLPSKHPLATRWRNCRPVNMRKRSISSWRWQSRLGRELLAGIMVPLCPVAKSDSEATKQSRRWRDYRPHPTTCQTKIVTEGMGCSPRTRRAGQVSSRASVRLRTGSARGSHYIKRSQSRSLTLTPPLLDEIQRRDPLTR